jgi:hypothetical protein
MKKQTISMIITLCLVLFTLDSFAKIGLIINKDLYPSVREEIQALANDINTIEGESIWIDSTTYNEENSAEDLRYHLFNMYYAVNLEGCIFIGNLPIATYELYEIDRIDDSDTNNIDTIWEYSSFPADLYFMDVNGQWNDNQHNGDWDGWANTGFYDEHVDGYWGNIQADIWVSRIIPGKIPGLGDEVTILKDYLKRVQNRMYGIDGMTETALLCGYDQGDRSWPSWLSMAAPELLEYGEDERTVYNRGNPDPDNRDSRANWLKGLRKGYEYGIIFEHSLATSHGGMLGFFSNWTYMNMAEEEAGISNVRFYNLFACSNTRYTVDNFLGGLYAFGHHGLLAVGSTKTGSMLRMDYYNTYLGEDANCFGKAFKRWFNTHVLTNRTDSKISWSYGMNLLGVGTLKLRRYEDDVFIYSYEISDNVYGNSDGLWNPEEQLDISTMVVNKSSQDIENVFTILSCDDPTVTLYNTVASYGTITQGEKKEAQQSFSYSVSDVNPHTITFTYTISDGSGNSWVTKRQVNYEVTIQAENGTFCTHSSGTSIDDDNAGYTGTGFINTDNATGKWTQLQINVAEAGYYKLEARYANNGGDSRGATITVNGENINFGEFRQTYDWEKWYTELFKGIYLNAGTNTIRLTATTSGGLANIDKYKLSVSPPPPTTIQAEDTEYCSWSSGTSIDNDNLGFTGTGFVNTANEMGKWLELEIDVPVSGTYQLDVRYANESSERGVDVIVNGDNIASAYFWSTYSWSSWRIESIDNIDLNAGTNTIRLTATTSGGLANIDRFEFHR